MRAPNWKSQMNKIYLFIPFIGVLLDFKNISLARQQEALRRLEEPGSVWRETHDHLQVTWRTSQLLPEMGLEGAGFELTAKKQIRVSVILLQGQTVKTLSLNNVG